MAAPDPGHDGPSTALDQHDQFLAVLCRRARLENEEIHKNREQLREEIDRALAHALEIEDRYWSGYHKRVANISKANQTGSTSSWARAFGETEGEIVKDKEAEQAKYHEIAMLKQNELVAVNREFWGSWRRHLDVMRGLSPLPLSSGSTSAAMMPKPLPQLLPKLSTTATEAMNAQNQSLTKTTRGLKGSAMQPIKSATPLTIPSPASLVSSPDPSIPASASVRPRHSSRKSMSTASPGKPDAPTPKSPTPKNALAAIRIPQEAPEEPSDSAQPAERHTAAAAEPEHKASFIPINFATLSPQAATKHAAPQSQDDGFNGVTDPKVGEIYKMYYEDSNCKGWWMCTLLPFKAWEREIGINYSFEKASLWDDWPENQYKVDRVPVRPKSRKTKKVITGFKDDFKDGGSKVRQRIFPVFMFDDDEGEPGNLKFPDSPEKPYTFPKRALKALPAEWVAAANLRPLNFDVGPVGGRETAGRFLDRLRARRELREKKGTPRDNSFREDTEMADLDSLSGATAVDSDTAGQPDGFAKTAQSGSEKEWRNVVLGDGS